MGFSALSSQVEIAARQAVTPAQVCYSPTNQSDQAELLAQAAAKHARVVKPMQINHVHQ
jgi:hypothetical protein